MCVGGGGSNSFSTNQDCQFGVSKEKKTTLMFDICTHKMLSIVSGMNSWRQPYAVKKGDFTEVILAIETPVQSTV